MSVQVNVDPSVIARMLRRRGGPAERNLRRRTERVAEIAETLAPGSMGDFVSWDVGQGPRGLQGVIVCDHPAVRFVLDGTRPHIIRPRRSKGRGGRAAALRFETGGRVVFAKQVRHPGTKANPFLQRALAAGK